MWLKWVEWVNPKLVGVSPFTSSSHIKVGLDLLKGVVLIPHFKKINKKFRFLNDFEFFFVLQKKKG